MMSHCAGRPAELEWVRRSQWSFHEPAVLQAWNAACATLEASGREDGLAALLLTGREAAPKSIETGPLLKQARWRLPLLVSSTGLGDVHAALAAAMPLIGAGPGLTPSWDDFLMGYLYGLRTSPSSNVRFARFIQEFGAAMKAESVRSTATSQVWIYRTVDGNDLPWIDAVLEAIGSGSVELSASQARRTLRVGHTSGTDSLFGALLGSALWKVHSYESELAERLGGLLVNVPKDDGVIT